MSTLNNDGLFDEIQRIAPDQPGKLTDEELGVIAAKALKNIHQTRPCEYRLAKMVAAVREAVERQHGEQIACLTAELACLQKTYEVERNCSAERMAKIHAHEEEIRRLTARTVGQLSEITSLHHLLDLEDAENAESKAELERLRWRPVSVKPTWEDADASGNVESITPKGRTLLRKFSSWPWELNHTTAHEVTHWRAFCPPPAPTPEEAERERFERAHSGEVLTDKESNWRTWQAARALKEGGEP